MGSALCLSVLLSLISSVSGRAETPVSRNVLIVDPQARVLGEEQPAVWLFDHMTNSVRLLSRSPSFVNPAGVALTPSRSHLYVVDADADPLGLDSDFGAVWRTDPGAQTDPSALAAFSSLFRTPVDILVEQDGGIILLDSDADPAGWGQSNGALFRIDPITNTVNLLATPSTFRDPRSLAWDRDGNILVLDRLANPLDIATSAGAIYRINRTSGSSTVLSALTRPAFQAPSAVAVIRHGPDAGDLIVADADADPEERGTRPGAVLRIPRAGGAPVVVVAHHEFAEPVDVLVGADGDLFVLDTEANPFLWPNAKGALFRFDLTTGDLISQASTPLFGRLQAMYEVTGPDLATSTVRLIDENQGLARPGDFFTVRASLVNSGTEPASSVLLESSLQDPWTFVIVSDSASVGQASYDPASRRFRWEGSLNAGGEAVIRYRIRLAGSAAPGTFHDHDVNVQIGDAVVAIPNQIEVRTEFAPGAQLFVDAILQQGQYVGQLYEVVPEIYPRLLWSGLPLRRPNDSEFLEDGSLIVLDEGRPSPGSDTLGAVIRFEPSRDRMTVLRHLTRDDGMAAPSGIVVGRDGSVVIVDRSANPQGHPPPPGSPGPGALFHLDWRTGELSLLLSDERWIQPLDGVLDRSGNLILLDPGLESAPRPALWRIPRVGGPPVERLLDPDLVIFPTGLALDMHNDIYLADPAGSRIVRVRSVSQTIVCDDPMLVSPSDLAILPDGRILITDRSANPRSYPIPNTGAIFYFTPDSQELEVATASPSLVRPDGASTSLPPDLDGSRIVFVDPEDESPRPGDTLRLSATVVNRGFIGLDNAMALIQLTPSLRLAHVDSIDGLVIDAEPGLVSWTGRSSIGETVTLNLEATVREGTPLGDEAGASLTVFAGPTPITSQVLRTVRAPLIPGDLLLADGESDPAGSGGNPGAVFRLREAGRKPAMLFSDPGIGGSVSALEWTPAGELLMAVVNGGEPGRLLLYNPDEDSPPGQVETIPGSPVDLFYSPGGDLFVVDRDVQGPVPESRGSLFRLEGGAAPLQLFSADSLYRSPTQGAFGPGGYIYLADPAADPEELGGNRGAVFRLDPGTGEVLDWLQHPSLLEPCGVLSYDDSTLVLTDMFGEGDGEEGATLFFYRPLSGTLRRMLSSTILGRPWRSFLHPGGEILILDQEPANPQSAGDGSVVGFDPVRQTVRYYALSDSFATPADIVQVPGPLVGFDSYTVIDLDGPPLHPADRVRVEARLHNRGPVTAVDVVLSDPVPVEAALLPHATGTDPEGSGVLEITPDQGLKWTGDIPPGESVTVFYEAQLNPALSQGRMIRFRAEARAPVAGGMSRSVQLQTHVPLEAGYLYMVDSSARPFGADVPGAGALFKVSLVTGSAAPMMVSEQFLRPRSLAFYEGERPFFLILDERASFAPGHRGTLFRLDPATRVLEPLAGHPTWSQPVKVLRWSDTEALVLDARSDPFDLRPDVLGPGAIYHVDLNSGTVTPAFSDTLFRVPTSIARLPGNRLAICDENAVPAGSLGGVGAVFSLDMDTEELRVFATSRHWRTPTSIASMPDGGLFLADRDDTEESSGMLFRISPTGGAVRLTESPLYRRLVEVQEDGSGLPLVTDNAADPFGLGRHPGAVFGFNSSVAGRAVPLSSSRLFSTPSGFVVYGDLTPAGSVTAMAEALAEGIRLNWRAPSDETGIRFLIYRREAGGPEDPGDPEPTAEYDLVSDGESYLGPGPHEYLDSAVVAGTWYVYLIACVDLTGAVSYAPAIAVRAAGDAAVLRLLPPRPNPSQGAGAIQFAVPPPGGEVRLELFDVSGRRVRVLHRGSSAPGIHTVLWQGVNDSGRSLGSGIYFLRLEHGGSVRTQRLVLLR